MKTAYLCTLALLFSGCVSQKKHSSVVDELAQSQAMAEDLESENASLTWELLEMSHKLSEQERDLVRARAQLIHRNYAARILQRTFEPMLEDGTMTLEVRDDSVALVFSNSVLFDSGSTALSTVGLNTLSHIAHLMNRTPHWDYQVEGHADSRPIDNEEFDNNWELAAERAVNVVTFLTDHVGVDSTQVSAVSYGATRPERTNATPAGRAENRRIEISVMPDLDKLVQGSGLYTSATASDAIDVE